MFEILKFPWKTNTALRGRERINYGQVWRGTRCQCVETAQKLYRSLRGGQEIKVIPPNRWRSFQRFQQINRVDRSIPGITKKDMRYFLRMRNGGIIDKGFEGESIRELAASFIHDCVLILCQTWITCISNKFSNGNTRV